MKPEDIENREFVVSLRGYARDEVDAFRAQIARAVRGLHERLNETLAELAASQAQLGAAQTELQAVKARLAEAEAAQERGAGPAEVAAAPGDVSDPRADAFRRVAQETERILVAAEEVAEELHEKALKEAAGIVADARLRAEKIFAEVEDTKRAAKEDLDRIGEFRGMLASQMEDIGRRLAETVGRLRVPVELPTGRPGGRARLGAELPRQPDVTSSERQIAERYAAERQTPDRLALQRQSESRLQAEREALARRDAVLARVAERELAEPFAGEAPPSPAETAPPAATGPAAPASRRGGAQAKPEPEPAPAVVDSKPQETKGPVPAEGEKPAQPAAAEAAPSQVDAAEAAAPEGKAEETPAPAAAPAPEPGVTGPAKTESKVAPGAAADSAQPTARTPAPKGKKARAVAAELAPAAEAGVNGATGTDAEEKSSLSELLEEIRRSRARTADRPAPPGPTSTVAAPVEVPAPAEEGPDSDAPDSGAPDEMLERRAEALGNLPLQASRRLKRLLQEDHNDLLDRLRTRRGKGTLEDNLVPLPEQFARFQSGLSEALAKAFSEGRKAAGGNGSADPSKAVNNLVARQVVNPLRAEIAGAVRGGLEAQDTPSAIAERASDVFRVWKGVRTELLGEGMVYAAFNQGLVDGWSRLPGVRKAWVTGDEDECPKGVCGKNAAAGPVTLKATFPSGHLNPPAHGGCTCTLKSV